MWTERSNSSASHLRLPTKGLRNRARQRSPANNPVIERSKPYGRPRHASNHRPRAKRGLANANPPRCRSCVPQLDNPSRPLLGSAEEPPDTSLNDLDMNAHYLAEKGLL